MPSSLGTLPDKTSSLPLNLSMSRLFPSKMTAFGLRTYGDESFAASQPTGQLGSSSIKPILTCRLGRFGQSSDIAGLALFLASPASAHITGTHTLLDGGSRFNRHSIAPSTKL